MPRRRYLCTDISVDTKVNQLSTFAALLYTWAIPHFLDDCRMTPRNPAEIKWTVVPARPESVTEVETAMQEIFLAELWGRDENGKIYIPSKSFYKFQTYINAANRRKTPENTGDHRESPEIAAKHRESPENTASPSPSPSPSLKEDLSSTVDEETASYGSEKGGAELSVKDLVDSWNEHFTKILPQVEWPLSSSRAQKTKVRIHEHPNLEFWSRVFSNIRSSDFLTGQSGRWKCTFDFLISNDTNAVKIYEGSYSNGKNSKQASFNRR